ncbi:helix-turn-helix domain-containing protein [Mesorhizobium xinjiangense]|uniref:helix-turn-helix domain-containing protein n=1 Tax=Mesorhizobium xinjiangense TaxID=2678685 RepID=UPI0018DD1BF2|nr:AraC family transcriptional regulator [Mesorhizobium xinjiangense]
MDHAPSVLPPNAGALSPIDVLPDTEAAGVNASLTPIAWTLRGNRNRAFVLISGAGALDFGGAAVPLAAPCILWLPAGKPARLVLQAGARGASLAVSELSLGRAVPAGPIGMQVKDALFHPILGTKLPTATAHDICRTIEAIGGELERGAAGSEEAARHHLVLVLIALWRTSSPQPANMQPAPRAIVRNFLHLVELHVRDHWTVDDYARLLSISRGRLTSAVKRVTGKSPLTLIHGRLIGEAEILLNGSSLQAAEVAEALGFKDAGYFNRFFKRETGMSPGRFRSALSLRRSPHRPSFADWP